MRKNLHRFPLWQKMLKKYKAIQVRITNSASTSEIKRLERKLEILKKRILNTNKKLTVGIATAILLSWMAAPVAAQDFDADVDGDGLVDYKRGSHIIWGTGGTPELDVNNLSQGEFTTIKFPTTEIRATWYDQWMNVTDFNNDGVSDLVCGVPSEFLLVNSTLEYYTYGRSLISFGGPGFRQDTLDLLAPNVNGKIDIYSDQIENVDFGATSRVLGDMNGDEIDDIKFESTDIGGGSWIIYGGSIQASDSINIADLTPDQATKTELDIRYPNTIDVNGDGIDDIVMTDYYSDKATIVFGNENGFGSELTLDNSDGFEINGEQGEYFGYRDAILLGDINHDGFNDIAIQNYDYAASSGTEEKLYIIFGGAEFPATLSVNDLNGSNGFVITDFVSSAFFKTEREYNGDGIDDFRIYGALEGTILGRCSGFPASTPFSEIIANEQELEFGLTAHPLCNFAELNVLLIDEQELYPVPNVEIKYQD